MTDFPIHHYLQTKGYGECDEMTGSLLLAMIMVSDSHGSWTKSAVEEFKKKQFQVSKKLTIDAASIASFGTFIKCRLSNGLIT